MFKNKIEKNYDTELNIEVCVESLDDKSSEEENEKVTNQKGLFGSLREEFAERTAEKNAIDRAVYEETKRLEYERNEAKRKNILRKISFIDNRYAQSEKERDEIALKKFRKAEQSKLDAIRSERRSALIKENRKSIAVVIVVLFVASAVLGVVASQKYKATIAKNYDHAVEYIMIEQYEQSFDILENMNYRDAKALCHYSETQMLLEGYRGKPSEFLNRLTSIEGIEHESVKNQYLDACSEIEKAIDIQADIDTIDTSSAEVITEKTEETIDRINEAKETIAKRYEVLIDTEKMEIASRVIFNRENNTEAWKLMSDLSELGDINLESKDIIDRLRKTYDGLSDEDKKSILNYSILTSAESKYAELQKEEEKRKAEEKEKAKETIEGVINSDEIFYASEIPLKSIKTEDLGYIKIKARSWAYHLDESWNFSLLDSDGSELYGFEIEKITDKQIERKDEGTFKKTKSKYTEERNYIFTMTGYGTWTPSTDEDGNGSFSFDLDRVLNIEYDWYDDPNDDALLYN